MNILIVGEYSGFAKNLKIGFESLGHQVVIFQEGDGWKKIDTGNNSYTFPFRQNIKFFNKQIRRTWILNSLKFVPKFNFIKKKYKSYFDVALLINYEFIRLENEFWLPQFSVTSLKVLLKKDSKIYLSACGGDYAYYKHAPYFRYSPFIDFKDHPYFSKRWLEVFERVKNGIVGVIPVMYDYAVAYRSIQESHKLNILPTIPLPIESTSFIPSNLVNGKIVIFHGLNTSMKGSEFIIEALHTIEKRYPTQVEIILNGKMPLNDYLKLIQRTNIVIDQCFAYGYGMNALYSMAMGKVVFSGNEPECATEFGLDNIPIVNILPNAKDIEEKIEQFIKNPSLIENYSKRSVEFVNKFHNTDIVAKQYIDIFNND